MATTTDKMLSLAQSDYESLVKCTGRYKYLTGKSLTYRDFLRKVTEYCLNAEDDKFLRIMK